MRICIVPSLLGVIKSLRHKLGASAQPKRGIMTVKKRKLVLPMQILNPDESVTQGPDRMLSQRHLSIVRLVIPKGTQIKRHRSLMTVTVVAIQGQITFHTDDAETTLVPGQAIVMQPAEFHWLEAPVEDGEVMVVHGVLAE
jgi:quercetin dioxygenase-like cupin family protein